VSRESARFSLQHYEVLVLAMTLLATVTISSLSLHEVRKDFRINRTSALAARFDSQEMVALREDTDRWLESQETPSSLYDRAAIQGAANRPDALKLLTELRTFTNFFQEFGTALKFDSLDEAYSQALLGAVCIRYANALEPFILETRKRRNRPLEYEEVFYLRERMGAMGAKSFSY
jgi:hypothetical protein